MYKRILIITLCFMLLLINDPLHAKTKVNPKKIDEAVISTNYIDLRYITSALSINSSGKAAVTVNVVTESSNKIITNVYLKRNEGGNWVTVKSWNDNEYNSYTSLYETVTVSAGYEYKVFTNCYLYEDGQYIESASLTSNSEYYW